MAVTKRGSWIFFVIGVPNLLRGLTARGKPWSTLDVVGFVSGVLLVTMGLFYLWVQRKTAAKEASAMQRLGGAPHDQA